MDSTADVRNQAGSAFGAAFDVTCVPPAVPGERYEVSQEAGRNQKSRQDIAQIVQETSNLQDFNLATLRASVTARAGFDRHALCIAAAVPKS
jgi:hypothetical protein